MSHRSCFPVPRGAPSVPALLCQHNLWSMYCMSAHGKAGSKLGTLRPCPHPVSPSCSVPLSSALSFGCCSWWGVRQVAPHGPPNPALLGLLQDEVLRSQVPQSAPCCHRILGCQGCHHHWVTRERLWGWILAPGTVVPCPFWCDAGLRVTLTLSRWGQGLARAFASHCQLKESQETHSPHVALGQFCVPHHPSARLGWGTPSSSTEHGTPSPCRAAERGWQVLA